MRPTAAQVACLAAAVPRGNHQVAYPASAWTDPIDTNLAWVYLAGEAGYTLERATAAARSGTYGLRLITRTAGAAPSDSLHAGQAFVRPSQDYLTYRAYCRLPVKANTFAAALHLSIFSGGHQYYAALLHITASNKWQYWSAGAALVDVPGGGYVWPDNTWVNVTLQVRYSTLRWGTVTWPGGSADLSAQGLYDAGASAVTSIICEAKIITSAAAAKTLHVADADLLHSPTA
jgi:hypothetical protein